MSAEIRERNTKVIWSFESSVLNKELAQKVASNDFDTIRLRYDEKNPESLISFLDDLQSSSPKGSVPVMLDMGAKARGMIINLNGRKTLNYKESITLSSQKECDVPIETDDWSDLFCLGAEVYFGFGKVRLRIKELTSEIATAEVIQGGEVYSPMEVHVPKTRKEPSLASLKNIDIKKFYNKGVNYVVLPGVTKPEEIILTRKKLAKENDQIPWLILKVDRKKTYKELKNLLPIIDGVMISRRELALTLEPASIPMITKEIIQLCNEHAKLVITASDMLGSMQKNPTPTRAEVSDIANSVMDGSDAVLLSEDISYGRHYEKALSICKDVINDIESNKNVRLNWHKQTPTIKDEFDAVSYEAYRTAKRLSAKAIVCITKKGGTALKLASFRQSTPIIAVTFSEEVKRKLSLVHGVESVVLDVDPKIDNVMPVVNNLLKQKSWLNIGDKIIFVAVSISSLSNEDSNLFSVQKIY